MSKHTPGRWYISNTMDGNSVIMGNGTIIADCSFTGKGRFNGQDNAERIVACVNAMEGIDDPAAARVIIDDPRTEKALAIYEELIVVLKDARQQLYEFGCTSRSIDEVLAKVEPKNASDETPCSCKEMSCPKRHYETNS